MNPLVVSVMSAISGYLTFIGLLYIRLQYHWSGTSDLGAIAFHGAFYLFIPWMFIALPISCIGSLYKNRSVATFLRNASISALICAILFSWTLPISGFGFNDPTYFFCTIGAGIVGSIVATSTRILPTANKNQHRTPEPLLSHDSL